MTGEGAARRTFLGGLFGRQHDADDPAQWLVRVARTADVPTGATVRVELSAADARRAELTHRTRGKLAWEAQRPPAIGLTNVDGHIYAYADACPHQYYSLAESTFEGSRVTCTLHGWGYDVATGAPVPPVKVGLATYRVVVDGDVVLLDLRRQPPPTSNTA